MNKFKEGDNVVLDNLYSTEKGKEPYVKIYSWEKIGMTGVVVYSEEAGEEVRVKWDENGETVTYGHFNLRHSEESLQIQGDCVDE